MTGQVLCSLEAPRAMGTGVGEFVHVAGGNLLERNWSAVGLMLTSAGRVVNITLTPKRLGNARVRGSRRLLQETARVRDKPLSQCIQPTHCSLLLVYYYSAEHHLSIVSWRLLHHRSLVSPS